MIIPKGKPRNHRVDILRLTPHQEVAQLLAETTLITRHENLHWPVYTYKFEGLNFSGVILADRRDTPLGFLCRGNITDKIDKVKDNVGEKIISEILHKI